MTDLPRRLSPALQTGFAAALLAGIAVLAHGGLRKRADAAALAELAGVLPATLYDNDPIRDRLMVRDPALGSDQPLPLWRARRGGAASALVVEAVAHGYGGPLRLRIGIAQDGRVLGVRVIAHHETRGLGDAFERDGGRWLAQLGGRSADDPPAARWTVRRDGGDFDQFAGATATPRAILQRVQAVLAAHAIHRDAWLAAESAP